MTDKRNHNRALVEEKPQPEAQLFREFEHALLDMERRMDRVVRDAFGAERDWPFPLVQGLSLQRGPNGLRLRPFGNLQESLDKFSEGWREPVLTYDLDEDANAIVFRAEVPGLKKEDLQVEVLPDGLRIEGESRSEAKGASTASRYKAQCSPGCTLDTTTAEAHYKDGVLTVACQLAEPAAAKARKLPIR